GIGAHDFELEAVIVGKGIQGTAVGVGDFLGTEQDHFQQALVVAFGRKRYPYGIKPFQSLQKFLLFMHGAGSYAQKTIQERTSAPDERKLHLYSRQFDDIMIIQCVSM